MNNFILSDFVRIYRDAETKEKTSIRISGYKTGEDGKTEYTNITIPMKKLGKAVKVTECVEGEAGLLITIPFKRAELIDRKSWNGGKGKDGDK